MKTLIAQLRRLFSPADKRKFIFIIMLMTISGVLELAGIGLLVGAVKIFLSPADHRKTTILIGIAAVALLLVLKNLFALLIINIQARFIRNKQHDLTERYFRACLNSSYLYYTAHTPSQFSGNIERILRMFDNFITPAMQLCADTVVILFLAAAAIYFLPWITIAGVAFMFFSSGTLYLFSRRLDRKLGAKRQLLDEAENKLRISALLGWLQIKSAGGEKIFSQRYSRLTGEICRNAASAYTLGQIPRLSLETCAIILACGIFAILFVCNVPMDQILLSFAVIVATLSRLLPALSRFSYNLTQLRCNMELTIAIIDSLFEIPQEKLTASTPAPDADNDISFDRITFAYPGKEAVFKEFSLTITRRSTHGISGKSGRGKSTLISLLLGLLSPGKGTISAGNVPVANDLHFWRQQCGYVPQDVTLFDCSLRENVAFGIPANEIDDDKVRQALLAAQLPDFTDRLQENISGTGKNISGGQKQRIGIARALYRDPKLLILDEATSALDQNTENAFCQTLQQLKGKMTIVIISHRQTTLNGCDQITEL